MEQRIEIEVRSVYGSLKVYPMNEQAKLLAQIAGTTTLTHATLCLAERMGFTIVEVFPTTQARWKMEARA